VERGSLCERKIEHSASDPAIAVFQRMQGFEPEVSDTGP